MSVSAGAYLLYNLSSLSCVRLLTSPISSMCVTFTGETAARGDELQRRGRLHSTVG